MRTVFSRQNLHSIVLAIAILALFSVVLFVPLSPIGYPLYQWDMTYNDEKVTVTLPISRMIQPGISLMSLKTTFPAVPGDTLVLPRISGNAVEVILNDEIIYRLGDFSTPSTNLWNSQLMVMLPESLGDENQLEIRIASSMFGIGMGATPYLAPYTQAAQRVALLNWIFNYLLMMTSGAAFVISLMLLFSCYLIRSWKRTEFFIGMGLLFCVVFNQDAFFRETSGDLVAYLWVTKGMINCGYLAGLCLICGLEIYNWKRLKISRWVAGAVALCMLFLLLTPDAYWLTRVNQYVTVLFFVFMAFCILFIFTSPKKSGWFRLIAFLIAISVLQEIYHLIFSPSTPSFLFYSISFSALIIGVNLMLELNRVFDENQLLRRDSNLDPLTGALNRRALKEIDINIYHFAILLDLNDFKTLNDCHGHMVGDQILIDLINVVRDNLRPNDLVIRWGGDEFLLVFANISETTHGYQIVENIIQRIADQYENMRPDLDLSFSYGIVTLQQPVERSLEEADRLMYDMKQVYRKKTQK